MLIICNFVPFLTPETVVFDVNHLIIFKL